MCTVRFHARLASVALAVCSAAVAAAGCEEQAKVGDPRSDAGTGSGPDGGVDIFADSESIDAILRKCTALCRRSDELYCEGNQRCCDDPERTYSSLDACLMGDAGCEDECEKFRPHADSILRWSGEGAEQLLQQIREETRTCTDSDHAYPLVWSLERGDRCGADYGACSEGLACVPETEEQDGPAYCREIGGLGAACSTFAECEEGLYCDRDGDAGTCREQLPLGAECDDWSMCKSEHCDFGCNAENTCCGSECDGVEGKCVESPHDLYCFASPQCSLSSRGERDCWYRWGCDDNEFEIECEQQEDFSFLCECRKNSVVKGTFETDDLCNRSFDEERVTAAANEGCEWDIELRPE